MAIDSLRKACTHDEVREMIRVREKARKDFATALKAAREEGLQIAEQERQKAQQERQKAERLAARLRELGLDPDLCSREQPNQ